MRTDEFNGLRILGNRITLCYHFMLLKPEIRAGLIGLLARMQTLYCLTLPRIGKKLIFLSYSVIKSFFFTFKYIIN